MDGSLDSRTNPLTWLVITMVGVIAGLLAAGPAVAQGSAQFTYRVNHSVFGDIGTYTNIVEPSRDGITVKTKAHFEVKMLGVRLHREDAERTERWQGNRLVSFHGVTDKGDGPQEVKGEARGNNFVITSSQGTVSAPASIHPANPWSSAFLHSNTMMRPDSGKIDGASIPAVKYEINGSTKYTVWLDARGVPVMFWVDDDTGKVAFTLTKCIGCNAEISLLDKKQ